MRPRTSMFSVMSRRIDGSISRAECCLQYVLCSLPLLACGGQTRPTPAGMGSGGTEVTDTAAGTSEDGTGVSSETSSTERDGTTSGGVVTDSGGVGASDSQSRGTGSGGTDSDGVGVSDSQAGETGIESDDEPLMRVDSVPDWGETGVPKNLEQWYAFESASFNERKCVIVFESKDYAGEGLYSACEKSRGETHICFCGYWYPGGDGFYIEEEPFVGQKLKPCVQAMEECSIRFFE